MVLDCEAIITSAMVRKESRGAHTRSDYRSKDDAHWLVNIITREKDGQMVHEIVPVERPPTDVAALIKE